MGFIKKLTSGNHTFILSCVKEYKTNITLYDEYEEGFNQELNENEIDYSNQVKIKDD